MSVVFPLRLNLHRETFQVFNLQEPLRLFPAGNKDQGIIQNCLILNVHKVMEKNVYFHGIDRHGARKWMERVWTPIKNPLDLAKDSFS